MSTNATILESSHARVFSEGTLFVVGLNPKPEAKFGGVPKRETPRGCRLRRLEGHPKLSGEEVMELEAQTGRDLGAYETSHVGLPRIGNLSIGGLVGMLRRSQVRRLQTKAYTEPLIRSRVILHPSLFLEKTDSGLHISPKASQKAKAKHQSLAQAAPSFMHRDSSHPRRAQRCQDLPASQISLVTGEKEKKNGPSFASRSWSKKKKHAETCPSQVPTACPQDLKRANRPMDFPLA